MLVDVCICENWVNLGNEFNQTIGYNSCQSGDAQLTIVHESEATKR